MNSPVQDVSRETQIETITLPRSLSKNTTEIMASVRMLFSNETDIFTIKAQADYEYLVGVIQKIKDHGKTIETARTVLVKPFLDTKKGIDAEFKVHSDWATEQERRAKTAMRQWDNKVAAKAAAEQAKKDAAARRKEDKLREQAEAAAEKGDIEKAQHLDEKANATTAVQVESVVKTEGVAKRWKFEVTITDRKEFIKAAASNPALASCLDINETALKKLAKMLDDEFDFPGVTSDKVRDYSI